MTTIDKLQDSVKAVEATLESLYDTMIVVSDMTLEWKDANTSEKQDDAIRKRTVALNNTNILMKQLAEVQGEMIDNFIAYAREIPKEAVMTDACYQIIRQVATKMSDYVNHKYEVIELLDRYHIEYDSNDFEIRLGIQRKKEEE